MRNGLQWSAQGESMTRDMGLYTLGETRVTTPESGQFWVAPNATVLGNVHIAENASVWFNSVLRGDNEPIKIGRGSNVQDGCVLHTDPGFPLTIEEDCTIGHMVMLHGCTIKRGSLIGIGAVVLNGAVIGEGSLIGAKALVPEGKIIPPGSVVMGVPGKIVREASDENRERNLSATRSYQNRWPEYAAGFKRQNG